MILLTVLRSLLFVPWLFFSVLFSAVRAWWVNYRGLENQKSSVGRQWCRWVLRFFSIQLETIGVEKIQRPGVIIYNHQSLFDIPILYTGLPFELRLGAKAELTRIPIFGPGIMRLGVFPIERRNREQAVSALNESTTLLRKGFFLVLAPEGTRQEADTLGPFKKGPFHISINEKVPIYPVAIRGSGKVYSKNSWLPALSAWRHQCQLIVGEPIFPEGKSVDTLLEKSRSWIKKAL